MDDATGYTNTIEFENATPNADAAKEPVIEIENENYDDDEVNDSYFGLQYSL